MASIFTKIINGDIRCHKIAENEEFFAFLDIAPVNTGHTLVVPKEEIDYLFDLDDELLGRLMKFSKRVAQAVEQVVDCQRVGVSVVGLEVPHAHVHLIPINSISDMSFENAKSGIPSEELAAIASRIREKLK